MTKATQQTDRKSKSAPSARDVLALAAWLGVVTGLVEADLLLAFQRLHWQPFSIAQWSVSLEIVWIAIVFDLLLFVAVGVTLVGLRHWFPPLMLVRWSLFLFVWLACFDWLAISGRLHASAVLILAAGLASVAMRWFSRREPSILRFVRRSLPWAVSTALLAPVGIEGGLRLKERIATAQLSAVPPGSPNILVIVVDTLRADHLSAYGYARATSPNLDRIARQGVLFENAYAASSWTLPSHASLLTGRYQYEYGPAGDYNDGRYPSLAQVLRADGYRTGAFSANTLFFCRAFGFGRGFLHFEDYYSSWTDMASRTLYGRKFIQYSRVPLGFNDFPGRKKASEVNREFLRWVDRAPGKHFFAFLNYFDGHRPYTPPQPYRSRFANSKNPGGIINEFTFPPQTPRDLTPQQLQSERDAYDGAVAYVDAHIGELFSDLEARGLAGNTLIVITSDHGEEFGDHGLLSHGNSLYRQEVQVPLIFWWPGKVPAGVRLGSLVTNVGLPATIMDALARSGQSTFPGPSLAQLWETSGTASDWPEPLAELARMPYDPLNRRPFAHGGIKSLITPRWQYIKNEKGEELYDWQQDPEELHNLAATPEGQTVDRDLLVRLRRIVGNSFRREEVRGQSQIKEPSLPGFSRTPASQQVR